MFMTSKYKSLLQVYAHASVFAKGVPPPTSGRQIQLQQYRDPHALNIEDLHMDNRAKMDPREWTEEISRGAYKRHQTITINEAAGATPKGCRLPIFLLKSCQHFLCVSTHWFG